MKPDAPKRREINFQFRAKVLLIPGAEEVWSAGLEHPLRVQPGRLHSKLPVHDEPPRRPRPQAGNLLANRPVYAWTGLQQNINLEMTIC